MDVKTFEDKPGYVALRIFGATGILLASMLLFLHPDAMVQAMSGMMAMVPNHNMQVSEHDAPESIGRSETGGGRRVQAALRMPHQNRGTAGIGTAFSPRDKMALEFRV